MTDFKKLRTLTPEEMAATPPEKVDQEYIRRNTTEPKEIANAPELPMTNQSSPDIESALAKLVLEYARDLRRNSSGGDDYPWEYAKATADYLEELVRRSGVTINMSHAIISENAQPQQEQK